MKEKVTKMKCCSQLYAESLNTQGDYALMTGKGDVNDLSMAVSVDDGTAPPRACPILSIDTNVPLAKDDNTAQREACPMLRIVTNVPRAKDYNSSPTHLGRPMLSIDTDVPQVLYHSSPECNDDHTWFSHGSARTTPTSVYAESPPIEDMGKWEPEHDDGLDNSIPAERAINAFKDVIFEVHRLEAEVELLNFDLFSPDAKDDPQAFRPIWQWEARNFSKELMTELDQNMFMRDLPAKLVREILSKLGQKEAVTALVEELIQMMGSLMEFIELKNPKASYQMNVNLIMI
ncbi:uncharacterized protein K452DRAFT_30931 [Aplosporella prunicola CBS 121167]|uniref:Uncharacterized protein n=1 Tax=Aplosporella prunicola CBS 121167 TaxID=1176127 RepID=A0A6A6BBW4_9PEZI|nr:uncharacterized protein K452DRAFT_30931 [Aplosporella prunicola CBS 121167]KAF2141610.1 hypothetical protein K452DRAFT_30931 [Aplosporella prunicola CBS 121167]